MYGSLVYVLYLTVALIVVLLLFAQFTNLVLMINIFRIIQVY